MLCIQNTFAQVMGAITALGPTMVFAIVVAMLTASLEGISSPSLLFGEYMKKEPKPKAQSTIDREDFLRKMKDFDLKYVGNSWGSSDFLANGEPLELAERLSKTGLRHFKLIAHNNGTCTLRVWVHSTYDCFNKYNKEHIVRIEVHNG